MSKYLDIYEAICPSDPVAADDPRRASIIAEMRRICLAADNRTAAKIVDWWGWDSDQELIAFVAKVRRMAARRG